MGRKYASLKDYLNEEHYDDIYHAVSNCIKRDRIHLGNDYIEEPYEHQIEDVSITSYYSQNPKPNDNCETVINAIVIADISITGDVYIDHHREEDTDSIRKYFSLILKVDIGDTVIIKNKFACPIDEREAFKLSDSETKSFIPYISEDNIEAKATQILTKIYPEALETPQIIDVEKFASILGLSIIHAELPERVFGQMLFADKADSLTSTVIPKKTILVDDTKSSFNAVMDERCTIIHESLHWILHKNFFKLLHLLSKELSGIECCSVEDDIELPKLHSDEFKWMEWQANALTPRILMPAKMVKQVVDKYINEFGYYGKISPENGALLISMLSKTFNVSKAMAKIRLLQLGYNQFRGIYEYSDKGELVSYSYKLDSISDEQTFSVSEIDALVALAFNSEIFKLAKEGKVIYVKGHLVVNSKEYVNRNEISKCYEFTDYALTHMDECSFAFDVKKKFKNDFDDRFYSLCFACRTAGSKDKLDKTLNAKSKHNAAIIEKARIVDEYKEEMDFANNLPGDFNKCFKEVVDTIYSDGLPNFSQMKRDSKVDNTTIESYYMGRSRPKSKKNLLAIISELELFPAVALKLMNSAEFYVDLSRREDDLFYCWLITYHSGEGADSWNEYILSYGKPEWLIPDSANIKDYK